MTSDATFLISKHSDKILDDHYIFFNPGSNDFEALLEFRVLA